jgi:hypothetical protein
MSEEKSLVGLTLGEATESKVTYDAGHEILVDEPNSLIT